MPGTLGTLGTLGRPGGAPRVRERQRIRARAPTSNTEFLAGMLEPFIAVFGLLILAKVMEGHVDRAVLLLAVLTLLVGFPGTNRFHHRGRRAVFDVWTAWSVKVLFFLACAWVTDSLHYFDAELLAVWCVLTPTLQMTAVLAGQVAIRMHYRRPETQRPVLVIGAGEVGARVAQVLQRRWNYGVRMKGYLEDRMQERQHVQSRGQVLGTFADLPKTIRELGIKDVYITLPLSMQPRIRKLLGAVQDEAVSIFLVPDVFGTRVINGRMHNMDGVPVVGLLETPFDGVNGLFKRASDIVLASVLLVLLSPLMLAIAVAVKLTSPGPVLFKQKRHGMNGREINVYKFRTMFHREADGPQVVQAQRGDARVTRLGAFLRKTSLDELPQFVNVLQGRMSVVGPRPHAVAHNELYKRLIPAYMVRHKVKPGITGWAQVNGLRGETDTDDKMAARVALDLDYLRMWSIGMDLRIIARTVKVVFGDRNAY